MILDLTHCISPEMTVYPGTEQPVLTTACTIREAGYRETILHMTCILTPALTWTPRPT